jgi:hypothetical protein
MVFKRDELQLLRGFHQVETVMNLHIWKQIHESDCSTTQYTFWVMYVYGRDRCAQAPSTSPSRIKNTPGVPLCFARWHYTTACAFLAAAGDKERIVKLSKSNAMSP